MEKIIQILTLSNTLKRIVFVTLILILILFGIFANHNAFKLIQEHFKLRGAIVTLIRSDNRSILLAINMIHSVTLFHSVDSASQYPFIIFHDHNFTSSMQQQILSCVFMSNKQVQISFALVDFQTDGQVEIKTRQDKPIGYRLMCRFWSYDIFYHPAVVQGQYDYLMRMDDDSYFSDVIKKDLFVYMDSKQLDYIYRGLYTEDISPMIPILQRFLNKTSTRLGCIYNNFFIIRLKWFYESKRVHNFLQEFIRDNLILREYIGDGCIHAGMLEVDNQVKFEHVTDVSYGHNTHLMASDYYRRYIYVSVVICLLICLIIFRYRRFSISPTRLDRFLTATICGRLIRYPNLTLTTSELTQLNTEASSFFSSPSSKDCSLFSRPITISSEELTYPLAFTILIHSNLEQFDFLLQTIYRKYNHYCVHVDLKSPLSLYQAIETRSKCVKNIYLPEKRFNVTWGQFSVLEAEHLCQKELLKKSTQWKYYFNLANSDIPLKTNAELVQILKLYHNQNDITSLPYHTQARQRNSLSNRILPSSLSLPLYKGEFHVTLSRLAVEFIHKNSRVADLYHYLNGTGVPDEHYYSIINRWHETPGFHPYNHDLSQISFMTRYKIWSDRPESRLCRGGFHRTICVFNYQDLWHLATSPHLFANKMLFQRDRVAPYCMAQYLDIRNEMKDEQKDFSMIDKPFYSELMNVQFGQKNSLK